MADKKLTTLEKTIKKSTLTQEEARRLNTIQEKVARNDPLTIAESYDHVVLNEQAKLNKEFIAIDRATSVPSIGPSQSVSVGLFDIDETATRDQMISSAEAIREAKQKYKYRVFNEATIEAANLQAANDKDALNISKLSEEEINLREKEGMYPPIKPPKDAFGFDGKKYEIDTEPIDQSTGQPYKFKTGDDVSVVLGGAPRNTPDPDNPKIMGPTTGPYGFKLNEFKTRLDTLFKDSGFGPIDDQYKTWFKYIDRLGINQLLPNHEQADIVFMTRPCLPLQSSSLHQDSFLSMYDTKNTNSSAFAIRCLLDTQFCGDNLRLSVKSAMNPYSPWLTPVSNSITSISGWPDPQLEVKTTEGGYHQEDQTYAKGGTGLNRTSNLTLNFKDVHGGPILQIFQIWIEVMALLRNGKMMAYFKHINANQLPYTVSIYRYNLDPSKRYLTNWGKATMCFPQSLPLGAIMNMSQNQKFISSATEYSIPFIANFVHYNKLEILMDFMTLTQRYLGGMSSADIDKLETLPPTIKNNNAGFPYFNFTERGIQLIYKQWPKNFKAALEG